MSMQNSGAGNSQGGSTSVGVGPANDRQGGSRESDGSQRATGGSGGSGLTRSLEDTGSDAPSQPVSGPMAGPDDVGEQVAGEGSAMTASTRGPQDTRSHQAGSSETGLGAPETGANQGPDDLAPKV
jgi:hypothetical protein